MSIPALRQQYRAGKLTPADVLEQIHTQIESTRAFNIWISLIPDDQVARYLRALENQDPSTLPLFGIPFAVKDNIDIANVPTTAACPAFAYMPTRSAFAITRLIKAGAIPVGKTNMDQFATGLVGTRSPYGATCNSKNPQFISGGSSSGSAVAVALGQASFALGTDTAGSGRVPAAFNQLVGYKPTRGFIGMTGVVPACRTLDCLSIFAGDIADVVSVLTQLGVEDVADAYSSHGSLDRAEVLHQLTLAAGLPDEFSFGVPSDSQLSFFGHGEYRERFQLFKSLLQEIGGVPKEIDFAPFTATARLLYEGPWVAERYLTAKETITNSPEQLLPEINTILQGATRFSALDTYSSMYRLQELKLLADRQMRDIDFVLTPTVGGCYTIEEVQQDPLQLNSNLGYYTNFMNLLDYAAVAIPGDKPGNRLPFGVTLFGPSGSDASLLNFCHSILQFLGMQKVTNRSGAATSARPATNGELYVR